MFWSPLQVRLILAFMSLTAVQGAIEPFQLQQDMANNITTFLDKVYTEKRYETLVMLKYNHKYCIDQNLEQNIKWPILLLDEHRTMYLKSSFNSELLMLICVPALDAQTDIQKLVHILATNLFHMRTARVVIFVNEEVKQNAIELVEFFKACEEHKFLNVVLLHRHSFHTKNFSSFTQFPLFDLKSRSLMDSAAIFPNLLNNLQGKTVLTLPDNISPLTMLYNDKQGRQQVAGYIGNLVQAFAYKYNCVLKFPFSLRNDELILILEIREFARNGTIDFGMSTSSPQRGLNIHEYSQFIEIIQVLTLWPIENEIPTYQLLVSVFRVELWGMIFLLGILVSILLIKLRNPDTKLSSNMLDFLLNDISIRGVLGQSFNMPAKPSFSFKLVCVIIFIAGLVNVTMYSSHLVELLADPPTQHRVSSFDDVIKQDRKIIIFGKDDIMDRLGEQFWEKYKTAFKIVKFQDSLDMIRKMDTRYGYMFISSKWPLMVEQQSCFARKLFRLSKELCFTGNLLTGIPLNENSFYKEPLNRLISQLQDTGILHHWTSMSFYEMVSLQQLSFEDLSDARVHGALSVDDFYWVWMLFIFLICLSLLAFLVERIIYGNVKKSERIRL